MIPLGILAAAQRRGPIGPRQTLLSTEHVGSDVVVALGGTAAEGRSSTGGSGVAISASGKSAGKYYAEVLCTAQYTSSQALAAGIHRGTTGLNSYLGGTANGWGTWNDGTGAFQRSTYHNGVRANIITPGVTALGQRARIAVDIDNGKVWLSYFGSTEWIGGGSPATGDSPTFQFAPDGADYYLALNPRGGNPTGSNVTRLVLVSPGAWASAPPIDFGIWTE